MRIVKTIEVTTEKTFCIYTCDRCGKELLRYEYGCGYDEEIEPYEFVATKGLSGARYCRKLHLCADCLNIEVKKFNYEFKEFCVRTGLTLEEK